MKTLTALALLLLAQTTQAFYDPNIGRWINRDPIGEDGGLNLHGFVENNPVGKIDPLGQRSIFGAGKVCVDKNCKASSVASMRYIPEDPPPRLVALPAPGNCVDADALYAPGFAWKVPDNARLTIVCDKCGDLEDFSYRKWPMLIGRGPIWELGKPKPKNWPGDIPPYPDQPPKE